MVSFKHKIIIPLTIVIFLGVLALTNILWRVNKLEDHPHERQLL